MTEQTMTFDVLPAGTVFSVDTETRTIRGRAVPYNVVTEKGGRRWSFSKGTVRPREGMRVKLWALHDQVHASGVVTEWDDNDDGLDVAFSVAPTPEGDRALAQADSGVWDGLSIGPSEGAKYALRDGVYHSVDVPIHEISLTPAPAFTGARVSSVKFDATTEGKTAMPDDITPEGAATVVAGAPNFDAITEAITAGFAGLTNPQGGPVVVTPAAATFEVNEPSPYRFDGLAGEHSFVDDMQAHMQGNIEAGQRLATFTQEVFAVTTTNVANLNPTQNRPDLYVPNLTYTRPLWEMVSTGTITDRTPFTVPKFSSASGLVGAHTEGVEPTPGAFAATAQTITPGAISGKVELNREVIDAGGNPKVDAIVWGEMLNGYYESVEAKIATALAAVGTAELNFAGAVDAALVDAVVNYYAGLQFVRGGNRYTGLALDGSLFPALVNAKDTTGRKLLPVVGPTNAQGTTSGAFDRVQIGNQTGRAAWALGSGNVAKSYSFVPTSVWAWASAPSKFLFEYQVKSVDLAIWGYSAAAVLRDSDVKPLDYTTADV